MPYGCDGNEETAPTTLMDGSRVLEAPVKLEGVDLPTVLTSFRISRVGQSRPGTAPASCFRRHPGLRAGGPAVVRVGVASVSVTFLESSRRAVFGCDDSPGAREANRRWCAVAYGVLHSGHLRDPRLSIGCRTRDGTPMGFVWIEPASNATFVVVEQPGYVEVYEVAAGLPVRVAATSGVEVEGSRASFDLREHDADGALLTAYHLESAVAG